MNMTTSLLIVESPAKAKTIGKYLGKDFTVLASYGHVRELPRKNGAIDVEHNFTPLYQVIKKNQKQLNNIIKAAKDANNIYLATDQDREGESISWHIYTILEEKKLITNKNIARISFNEITKPAILEALKHPKQINIKLVDAQQTRLSLDYLIGFNVSPLLWRKVKAGLSAGRVQSPALRLICEREAEIKAFISQDYYSIHLLSEQTAIKLNAKLIEFKGDKIEQKSIEQQQDAVKIVNTLSKYSSAKVVNITHKQRQEKPTPPFITSSLQIEASRRLGFNSNKTMRIAQNLYEGISLKNESLGLITYMRTDCVQISNIAIEEIRQFITNNFASEYLPAKANSYSNRSKNAQEAHEAIRPTDINLSPDKIKQYLDDDQYKLYDLIWKRTLASQITAAIYNRCAIDIAIEDLAIFRLNGQTIVFDGYTKVFNFLQEEENDNEESSQIPDFKENDIINIQEINYQKHSTQPKPRFSEASLTKQLEELGIGRPSTWSAILPTLQKREYVIFENKKIIPSDIGVIVNGFLCNHLEKYVDLNFTAELEDELDDIAIGAKTRLPILKKFWNELDATLKEKQGIPKADVVSQKLDRLCPLCETHLVERLGKYGKFVGCAAYPTCKYIEKNDNTTTPNKVFIKCPSCQQGDIVARKGRFGIFYSCTQYPNCKTIFKYPPINVPCSSCAQSVTMLHFTKTKGYKIICPQCKHTESASEEIIAKYAE
jgi:DNA topoisomerase-1